MRIFLAAVFFVSALTSETLSEIRAHLVLEDYVQAELALQSAPRTLPYQKLMLEFYATQGRDQELLFTWNGLTYEHPELVEDRNLLKVLSWGIIESGKRSRAPQTRLLSFLAAYLTQEAPAVLALEQALSDQNPKIRVVAAKLTEHYPDRRIQKALVNRLEKEKNLDVRLEVIDAVAALRVKEAKQPLEKILAHWNTAEEERGKVIAAYCALTEEINEASLLTLRDHSHAGMRLLGCALVLHTHDVEKVVLLYPLLSDTNHQVRAAALYLFHWKGESVWRNFLKDPHPHVQMIAGWSALRESSQMGELFFREKLRAVKGQDRRLIAAALSSGGKGSAPLIEEVIQDEKDPIVLTHLALGLIGQRESLNLAQKALLDALQRKKRMWVWKKEVGLPVLSQNPKRISNNPMDSQVWEDLMVRMELIEALHLAGSDEALSYMRALLKEPSWGAVLGGSALLLAHGPKEGSSLITELLDDRDPDVALQAAFILGRFQKDPKAVQALHGHFQTATRKKKELILEALGQIGSSDSIPFLIEVLSDPHQHLRLIAASSLLLCCK